jgi:ABC-type polysaccharide/polyol phosphate export permease
MSDSSIAERLGDFLAFGFKAHTRASARNARRDVALGLGRWRIWWRLAWHDIIQRYERTVLGPFWITLSVSFTVIGLGLVFSAIFHNDIQVYLPFLAAGLMGWTLISGIVSESSNVFIQAHQIIRSMAMPLTVHIYRMIARNVLVFGHHLIAFAVLVVVLDVPVNVNTLLLIPGVLLLAANGVWIGLVLALLGARFRDTGQIVSSIFQVLFFITPIMWMPNYIQGHRTYWIKGNPLYHAVEILRAPMLGQVPHWTSYAVMAGFLVVGSLAGFMMFRYFRRRVAYWI